MTRITVQAYYKGEYSEFTAKSETKTEQQMIDWMYENAKPGVGLRFLCKDGYMDPLALSLPALTF